MVDVHNFPAIVSSLKKKDKCLLICMFTVLQITCLFCEHCSIAYTASLHTNQMKAILIEKATSGTLVGTSKDKNDHNKNLKSYDLEQRLTCTQACDKVTYQKYNTQL